MPCSGICYLCLYYFWSEKKLSIISHYFTVLHLTTTKTCPIIYQYVYIELSVSGFNVTIMNNNDYKLEVYGLANIKSAKKRILVTETRAARNKAIRSEVKTSIKKVEAAVAANDKEAAKAALTVAISTIESASSKGIYHKNNSARKVSRLTKLVNG